MVVPWAKLCAEIDPFYPKSSGPGRPPVGVERMLRISFLQHWFNLSDPMVKGVLYDSLAMRSFVSIDLPPTDENLSVGTPISASFSRSEKYAPSNAGLNT